MEASLVIIFACRMDKKIEIWFLSLLLFLRYGRICTSHTLLQGNHSITVFATHVLHDVAHAALMSFKNHKINSNCTDICL